MASPASLPPIAAGTVYGIDFYEWLPFICCVRDDGVSVFTLPKETTEFRKVPLDAAMSTHTEEVATFLDPVKIWVGGSWDGSRLVGNMLVHVAKGKGKPYLVSIRDEGLELHVSCADLSGSTLICTSLPHHATVADLVAEGRAALQCTNVRCLDENGANVPENCPLRSFHSLCLQDSTNTYVYIGPEIFSFESAEDIVSFHSGMAHNGDVEPAASTAENTYSLEDCSVTCGHLTGKGKGKGKGRGDTREENHDASCCTRWMLNKIVLHRGAQDFL
mmetsp:Transcript_1222/g.2725  ORF Transcript_1222/g.2725 Transcript_1222/m.2725 type:complete len:275 (+) Transcript_1222:64-888(+)|eukprot:CAMPEP_0115215064 /NCGR_PEP_ID=MMETSP0270-20121206/24622_1 /TAXON_ID=71861 /ORGANISM="Scrippsiella trochoidea, Strain CCMP3099" /LENGTH=274 /DNA_ID=CAMNT_0002628843 /DNA_START=35 /DNA_END=859 /DNA_ORIENTATION=-